MYKLEIRVTFGWLENKVFNIICNHQNVNFAIEFDFENYARRYSITIKYFKQLHTFP